MKSILTNQRIPSAQDVPKETTKVYRYTERKYFIFHHPPAETPSSKTIKIIFINLYLSTL
jgi:hypothetical protein